MVSGSRELDTMGFSFFGQACCPCSKTTLQKNGPPAKPANRSLKGLTSGAIRKVPLSPTGEILRVEVQ